MTQVIHSWQLGSQKGELKGLPLIFHLLDTTFTNTLRFLGYKQKLLIVTV